MAVLNQLAVRRAIGYKQEMETTIVKPLASSVAMSLIAYGVYRLVLLSGCDERIAVRVTFFSTIPESVL